MKSDSSDIEKRAKFSKDIGSSNFRPVSMLNLVRLLLKTFPSWHLLVQINSRNTRRRCKICLKLAIKPKWRHWRRSDIFIVNLEHIPHLFPVFLLLTLNKQMLAKGVCLIWNTEQVSLLFPAGKYKYKLSLFEPKLNPISCFYRELQIRNR